MYDFFTSGLKPSAPVMWTIVEDPQPPVDDEANDAKPPEPDLPQHEDADSVKNHEVPTDDDD